MVDIIKRVGIDAVSIRGAVADSQIDAEKQLGGPAVQAGVNTSPVYGKRGELTGYDVITSWVPAPPPVKPMGTLKHG